MTRGFQVTGSLLLQSLIAAVLIGLCGSSTRAAWTAIGPLPYLSAADSPFVANPAITTTIEDFEDGVLNLPGVFNQELSPTIPPSGDGLGIVMGPASDTDSVDGDDGLIDGSGIGGHSLQTAFFGSVLNGTYSTGISFDLLPDSRGRYPVACGFVWTDGEINSSVWITVHEVGAIGSVGYKFAGLVGDAVLSGGAAEDRFFGMTSTIGFDRFSIESVYDGPDARLSYIELDHLQIAYAAVPEPSGIFASIAGAAFLATARHRRSPGSY